MTGCHRASAAGLALAAALVSAPPAAAFCPTTTCDQTAPPDDENACRLVDGCLVGGHRLHWQPACISYSVQEDGSARLDISYQVANRIIGNAFDKWTASDCDGQQPSLQVFPTEPVSCARQEYNQNGPNANLWVFRDEGWPYREDEGDWTLGLTTVTFNPENGEIYDADVEINSHGSAITVGDEEVANDFDSIVTHEAGHVLGLEHSLDPEATMYASYLEGSTSLRSLSPDDEAGMCSIYPPDRSTGACDPEPRHGFSTECARPPDEGCFCAAAAKTGRTTLWALALLGVALAALARRRRATEP
jgi:MYXO-CTERM domain-containing protein